MLILVPVRRDLEGPRRPPRKRRLVLAAPPRVELEPQLRALRRPLGRLLVDPVDAGLLDVAVAAEGGGEGEHAVACGLVLRRRDDAGTAQQILRPRRS